MAVVFCITDVKKGSLFTQNSIGRNNAGQGTIPSPLSNSI